MISHIRTSRKVIRSLLV